MCFSNVYDFFSFTEFKKLIYNFESLGLKPMQGKWSCVLDCACAPSGVRINGNLAMWSCRATPHGFKLMATLCKWGWYVTSMQPFRSSLWSNGQGWTLTIHYNQLQAPTWQNISFLRCHVGLNSFLSQWQHAKWHLESHTIMIRICWVQNWRAHCIPWESTNLRIHQCITLLDFHSKWRHLHKSRSVVHFCKPIAHLVYMVQESMSLPLPSSVGVERF